MILWKVLCLKSLPLCLPFLQDVGSLTPGDNILIYCRVFTYEGGLTEVTFECVHFISKG